MEDTHQYRLLICGSCGHKLNVPISCGNRFCSICGGPRRRRVRARLNSIVKSLRPGPGYSTKMVTLTMPKQPDLRSGVKVLLQSFRRLRQRKFWKNKVVGGAFVVEVKGIPGAWNIHLHCIVEARFIPNFTLSREWAQVSPGQITDVIKVPASAVISYVTKYLTKSSVAKHLEVEVSRALKGVRMFQPFGTWHSLALRWKPEIFKCPSCDYTGFYLSDSGCAWESYGRAPPTGSLDRQRRDKMALKHGIPEWKNSLHRLPYAHESRVTWVRN